MHDILRSGTVRGGMLALIIKLVSAGLTFGMFVFIARYLGQAEYGRFAFGFSLASFLAVVALLGQQTAIVRFWPEYVSTNKLSFAKGSLFVGYKATFIGSLTIMGSVLLGLVFGSQILGLQMEGYLIAATALILPMALAEYQLNALRATGYIATALIPRDILWRLGVPLIVFILFILHFKPTATLVLWVSAGSLALILFLQTFIFYRRIRPYLTPAKPKLNFQEWRKRSFGFWGINVFTIIKGNIDIIVLGLFLKPEITGAYFSAFKIAMLLSLFLLAANIVGAPLISRYYHSNKLHQTKLLCRNITLIAAGPTFLAFVALIFFGDKVLAWFDPAFASEHMVLIVLAAGFMARVLFGPTGDLLSMTGHEDKLLHFLIVVNGGSVLVLLIVVPLFGLMGAAIVNALAFVVLNFWIRFYSIKHLRIDPSILSVFSARPLKKKGK